MRWIGRATVAGFMVGVALSASFFDYLQLIRSGHPFGGLQGMCMQGIVFGFAAGLCVAWWQAMTALNEMWHGWKRRI